MAGTTARLALPFPQLTDAADIAQAVPPLTTLLDTIAVAYAKGLLSARPAASATQLGRLYYATDNGITYFCDGTTWQRLDLDALNRIIALEAKIPTAVSSFRVRRTTSLAFAASGTNILNWQSTEHALNAFSAITGATTTWTIPVTGVYDYFFNWEPDGDPSVTGDYAQVAVRSNTVIIDEMWLPSTNLGAAQNGILLSGCIAGIRQFTAGDVVDTTLASGGSPTNHHWKGSFQMKLNRV